MEIIKNHVFLKGRIIEIHWKNNVFLWFRRLHLRTVKVSKKTSKIKPTSIRKSMKIDTKNMLEKGMQKS